jgi:SAM-dependent methyltransferase
MRCDNSDRAWERWGALDPYYAVCSKPEFLSTNLDENSVRSFFDSGEKHVEWVFWTVAEHLDAHFKPRVALDFGCGVGRITIPLAKQCERVIAVDISEAMLEETRKNLDERGLGNVDLFRSDDSLSQVPCGYDFLHSHIVFQHMSRSRGLAVTRRLVERLEYGGVGALHYVFLNKASFTVRMSKWVRTNVPLAHGVINLFRGRSWRHPLMQMNAYSLNGLFEVLYEAGCSRAYIQFTNHGGYIGIVLLFVKNSGRAVAGYRP